MSMHDFYARLTSDRDDPFFVILRKLRRVDPRVLQADGDESNAWSAWDATGSPPDGLLMVAEPACAS